MSLLSESPQTTSTLAEAMSDLGRMQDGVTSQLLGATSTAGMFADLMASVERQCRTLS